MNEYSTIFDLFKNLITSFSDIWSFLITPIQILDMSVAPIFIFTGAGIIAYLVIAIALWIK